MNEGRKEGEEKVSPCSALQRFILNEASQFIRLVVVMEFHTYILQ